MRRTIFVSIPFASGLTLLQNFFEVKQQCVRLNPLRIGANSPSGEKSNMTIPNGIVSIPFASGLTLLQYKENMMYMCSMRLNPLRIGANSPSDRSFEKNHKPRLSQSPSHRG